MMETIASLVELLRAEKEEKRQLYNRFKALERDRDNLHDRVAKDNATLKELEIARQEIVSLCAMLDKQRTT